jgi:hypothetical protein
VDGAVTRPRARRRAPAGLKPKLTLVRVARFTTVARGTGARDVLDRAGVPHQFIHEHQGWCFPSLREDDVIAAARSLNGTVQDHTGSLW